MTAVTWVRQLITKLWLLVLAALLCCQASPVEAAESWGLLSGGSALGEVPVRASDGAYMAAVDLMASLLGCSVQGDSQELKVSAGGKMDLRFVGDAAAAWMGYNIISLPRRTFFSDGHWWCEAQTSLRMFSALMEEQGKGPLSWGNSAHQTAPAPVPTAAARTAEPAAPPVPSGGALPRLLGLRWGTHDNKIRIVADLQEGPSPKVGVVPGKVFLKVAPLKGSLQSQLASQEPSVNLTVKNGAEAELAFFFPNRNATAFELQNPHRYVIDIPREGGSSGSPSLESRWEALAAAPSASAPEPSAAAPASGLSPRREPTRRSRPLVAIDPGHGGKDPGAIGGRYQEKVIALQIAKRLAEEVQKLGMDVRMTRSGDSYPTLRQRTAMANEWKADAFISVHLNALPKGRHAKGVEIYIMALPTDKDAMELARIENAEIAEGTGSAAMNSGQQNEMLLSILGDLQQNAKIVESTAFAEVLFESGKKAGLHMRRVAQAPFWVLRGAAMPAVLIETGFITEPSEAKMLADPSYQAKMAKAVAQGIAQYLK